MTGKKGIGQTNPTKCHFAHHKPRIDWRWTKPGPSWWEDHNLPSETRRGLFQRSWMHFKFHSNNGI